MQGKYNNTNIYKQLKVIRVLLLLSLIFAILILIARIFMLYFNNSSFFSSELLFGFYLIGTPAIVLASVDGYKTYNYSLWGNKSYDDASYLVRILIAQIPFFLGAVSCCCLSGHIGLAYLVGYALPSHVFVWIVDILLVNVAWTIKEEWKTNPPPQVIDKILQKEIERQNSLYGENYAFYKECIEKCGIRFFIKYFEQVKTLPLRDIATCEAMSSQERTERLANVKKIIDKGLTEFALRQIIVEYGNFLEEELFTAKELLKKQIYAEAVK